MIRPGAAAMIAAGDPLRLEILRVLSQDSFGVLELCRVFGLKQSGMSRIKRGGDEGVKPARRSR